MKRSLLIFLCFLLPALTLYGQEKDSLIITPAGKITSPEAIAVINDTAKKYDPRIAIRRSAILPGWGQYTNKKYWKIPLVYGALGTTTFLFFRNLKQYKDAKSAFILATDGDPSNDYLIKQPYFDVKDQPSRIRAFRNVVRQNLDYSALFFLVFWGLNVADAAVDAHLKTFDVNEDLSLHIRPGYSPLAQTNGLSLVLSIGSR